MSRRAWIALGIFAVLSGALLALGLHLRSESRRQAYLRLLYEIDITNQECRRAAAVTRHLWDESGPDRLIDRLKVERDIYPDFSRAEEAFRLIDPTLAAARPRSSEEQRLAVELYAIDGRLCKLAQLPVGESRVSFGAFVSKFAEEFDRKMAQAKFSAEAQAEAPPELVADFKSEIERAERDAAVRLTNELKAAEEKRKARAEVERAEQAAAADAALAADIQKDNPGTLDLELSLAGDCFIEATLDGSRLIEEARSAGERVVYTAARTVRLSLSRPQAVSLKVDGRPYPLDQLGPIRDMLFERGPS